MTYGYDLIAPDVLPFEVGNALSSLLRNGKLKSGMATEVWDIVADIPVELKPFDIRSAVAIADKYKIYMPTTHIFLSVLITGEAHC